MKHKTSEGRLKVCIADPQTFFRQMLQKFLEETSLYQVVASVDTGQRLIELFDTRAMTDIVLLNFEAQGVETARRINMLNPETRILFFCEQAPAINIKDTLLHMVKGVLLKSCGSEEILHALQVTTGNNHYISPALHNHVADALRKNTYTSTSTSDLPVLNEKERRFLQLLCSELELKDIASQMHLGSRSIEYYRNSIYKKLNVKTKTGAVIYCIRYQLVAV